MHPLLSLLLLIEQEILRFESILPGVIEGLAMVSVFLIK
jgi:hypothetical protein